MTPCGICRAWTDNVQEVVFKAGGVQQPPIQICSPCMLILVEVIQEMIRESDQLRAWQAEFLARIGADKS